MSVMLDYDLVGQQDVGSLIPEVEVIVVVSSVRFMKQLFFKLRSDFSATISDFNNIE